MIEVTSEAAERIRALLSEDGKLESHGLRMKVVGGGCSGLQYQLSFDDVITTVGAVASYRTLTPSPERSRLSAKSCASLVSVATV